MLRAVTKCPETADFEDRRTEASLALIQYLRKSHRHDLYTRCVHDGHGARDAWNTVTVCLLLFVLHPAMCKFCVLCIPVLPTRLKKQKPISCTPICCHGVTWIAYQLFKTITTKCAVCRADLSCTKLCD